MIKFLHITTVLLLFTFSFLNLSAQNNLWVKDITHDVGLDSAKGSRIVVVDVNNDDYPDLLWGTGGAGKNKFYLYLNVENPDNQSSYKRIFKDFTDESGINVNRDLNKTGRVIDVASMADVDNDGDMDLVTSIYYHRLEYYKDTLDPGDRSEVYLNDGQGHFALVPNNGLFDMIPITNWPSGLINTTGMSFLDYDMDGNIDLYITTWFGDRAKGIGMPDFLMKGNGDGSFTDTKTALFSANYYPMYGVNVTDWDNDGWPDILTSPYCNSNGNLFRNMQDGTFQDYSAQGNYSAMHYTGDNGQTLCQWEAQPADIDNDGDIDILQVFVHGGYHNNEGRTHASINEGPDNGYRLSPDLELIERDAPLQSHLGDQGGQWFDLDGDGFQDVAIGQMAYPQANLEGQERLYICIQDKNGVFKDISKDIGVFHTIKEAHSIEPLDFDLDGDQDLFVSHQVRDTIWSDGEVESIKVFMQIRLLDNNVADIVTNSDYHRWLSVKVVPPANCNQSGIGSRIYVYCNGVQYMQDIQAGLGHFAGQQPFIKNFGLDYSPSNIDSVVVRWPNKQLQKTVVKGVPLNTVITIDENGYEGYKKTWDLVKPVITVNNSNLNFGIVDVGMDKTLDIELINLGEADLIIDSIDGLSSNDFEFSFPLTFPIVVQPGAQNSMDIALKFTPTKREEFEGKILIHSNAFNDSITLVRYSAYGFEEQAIIVSDDEEYDFGNIFTDSAATGFIKIENKGELDLVIHSIDDKALPSEFILKDIPNLPLTLKPDESTIIEIEFKPSEEKDYAAIFTIGSNAYNESDLHIKLTGKGEERKPQIQIITASYLFGNIDIGNTRDKTMNIKNTGTGELIISNITFEQPFQDVYIYKDFTLPVHIAPLSETDITIEFKPKEIKSYKTKIYLHSNSLTDSVFTIQFIGTGREPSDVEEIFDQNNSLTVYPNPANDNCQIIINPKIEILEISVIDIQGNVILSYNSDDIWNNIIKLDVKNFNKGTYLIKGVTKDGVNTVKMIVY